MEIRWLTAFLDTPRQGPDALAFWERVTGATASARRGARREFATLVPPEGDAFIRTQDVSRPEPGSHLDIHVDDVRAASARAVALGATITTDAGFVTLASPTGLAFCVVPHHGESVRPAPRRWPGGQRSLVDQLCLDIAPADFEAEAAFWAAFTGWERRQGRHREFEHLARPANMPLRLLLQRLDNSAPGRATRAHLDFACDDTEAEATRHRSLGAALVRRREWITLRDPAGREYCVTARDPFTGQ